MSPMTNRERQLAFIRGETHDQVPFIQYSNAAAPNEEIWSVVGRNNMGLLRWSAAHRIEHPNCPIESEPFVQDGLRHERRTLHTPVGTLTELRHFEPTYGGRAWKKHFIETPEDYAPFAAYLRDVVVLDDWEHVWTDWRELDDDGLPLVATMRTPYQQMWIEWVGLQNLSWHMAEAPEVVEECLGLLADIERRIFDSVCRAIESGVPIPMVNIGDNITAPAIGVRNFRAYCVPLYQELSARLAPHGVPVFVHMDGNLKPLWELIGASGVRGLDSMSPPPDNDTSVAQARALWPEMRIGVNFPSSVHLAPPEDVYRMAMRLLEEGGRAGRLQIQISENVPPGMWRNSYPQIVRAIRDFGPAVG